MKICGFFFQALTYHLSIDLHPHHMMKVKGDIEMKDIEMIATVMMDLEVTVFEIIATMTVKTDTMKELTEIIELREMEETDTNLIESLITAHLMIIHLYKPGMTILKRFL